MNTRTRPAALAGILAAGLALAGCSSNAESAEASPSPTPADSAPADSSPADSSPASVSPADSSESAEPAGLQMLAPNGEIWTVNKSQNLDSLLENGEPATPTGGPAPVDCAEDWGSTDFLVLRAGPHGLDDIEIYGHGAEAGPTCFEAPGGAPADPQVRQAHFICQTSNSTARALVSDPEGGPAVWTPEHTAGDDRECLAFGGSEILVHEVEVVNH